MPFFLLPLDHWKRSAVLDCSLAAREENTANTKCLFVSLSLCLFARLKNNNTSLAEKIVDDNDLWVFSCEFRYLIVSLTLSKILRHGNKNKIHFFCISHNLIVSLTLSKILSLENPKNMKIFIFIWHFTRLIVSLHSQWEISRYVEATSTPN